MHWMRILTLDLLSILCRMVQTQLLFLGNAIFAVGLPPVTKVLYPTFLKRSETGPTRLSYHSLRRPGLTISSNG